MIEIGACVEISDRLALPAEPLVSVCMVTYRHERFIAQAIESIVAQQCSFPIELILSDDHSPDGTGGIARDFQRRYPGLIRLLESPTNVGAYANELRCIEACRGEYIAVCEGDDFWIDTEKLERQVAVLTKDPECLLVFNPSSIVDTDRQSRGVTGKAAIWSRVVSVNEVIQGDGGYIPTSSMMFRRDLSLTRPLWWTAAPIGDYPLALRATLTGHVVYVNRVMSAYRIGVPFSWTNRYTSNFRERLAHARKIDEMMQGFLLAGGDKNRKAVAAVISKYYSDVLVRLPAGVEDRRRAYRELADKLTGSDRWLAWLATKTNVDFSG